MRDTQGQVIATYSLDNLDDLIPVAQAIIKEAAQLPIILLLGEMGSGKTTLTKAIMQQLGLMETSSPTFSLVNRYDTDAGTWFHFDLYRVEDQGELYDLGFETYIDSGSPCLIEWPQIASSIIQPPYLQVSLAVEESGRTISLTAVTA